MASFCSIWRSELYITKSTINLENVDLDLWEMSSIVARSSSTGGTRNWATVYELAQVLVGCEKLKQINSDNPNTYRGW